MCGFPRPTPELRHEPGQDLLGTTSMGSSQRDTLKYLTASLILALIAGISQPLAAQEDEVEELETERDSFTQALTLVGKGRFAVESAYSFIDNKDAKETHSFPELLLRYGLTENFEIQFGANYEVGGESSAFFTGENFEEVEEGGELEEEAKIFYGLKTQTTKQNGWLPESAFTVTGYTPTSGEETSTSLLAGYVAGWEFGEGWEWAAEMRYGKFSNDGDNFNSWLPSTLLKFPLPLERTVGHIEYFGIFSDGREEEVVKHFITPGVHHLLTPDFEFGVRLFWGLNEQSANFATNIGFGYRF